MAPRHHFSPALGMYHVLLGTHYDAFMLHPAMLRMS